jgi:hypothetical protein
MANFPRGGVDFIQHDLRIELSNQDRKYEEIVKLTGAMMIQRANPYRNKSGYRTIDFKVISWVASGWIESMGAAISYVSTEGEDQPVSTIESEQPKSDFPATFNFNVLFDVRINNELVFRRLHGRPKGLHFREVPPTGTRRLSPTITEFVDLDQVRVEFPRFGTIVARPIDCNDRGGKTLHRLPGRELIRPLGIRLR